MLGLLITHFLYTRSRKLVGLVYNFNLLSVGEGDPVVTKTIALYYNELCIHMSRCRRCKCSIQLGECIASPPCRDNRPICQYSSITLQCVQYELYIEAC